MEKIDLLIKNAHILTMDENFTEYLNGDIAVQNGKILDIGENLLSKYEPEETIDASNKIALPGLINTHTHAAMTLLRGYGSDNPLNVWLEQYIWPVEGKFVSYEFVKDGTDIAIYEMIRNGVTTFVDMYFYENAVADSILETGVRGVLCTGILDFPNPGAKTPDEGIEKTKQFIQQYKDSEFIFPCIGPHAPYTCSSETLQKAMAVAQDYDVLFHIHVAETEWEINEIQKRYGTTPVKHLDNVGVLNERVLAAHMVHPTKEEINLLAQKNVKVAHCPESNLKLASGIAPVPEMIEAGVTVGVGTDGTASNDDLDIIGEIHTAALIQKGYRKNPVIMNARQSLAMATREGAKALRLEDKIGTLEKNKFADIILINKNEVHLQPMFDPYTQIVYSGKGLDVDTVVINGKILMKDKKVIVLDKKEILEKAYIWQNRIRNMNKSIDL